MCMRNDSVQGALGATSKAKKNPASANYLAAMRILPVLYCHAMEKAVLAFAAKGILC